MAKLSKRELVVSNIVNSVFESKPQQNIKTPESLSVVSNIVNSVFESKPQLGTKAILIEPLLCQISLILFLKANHNWLFARNTGLQLCQISLILFLKANHNIIVNAS